MKNSNRKHFRNGSVKQHIIHVLVWFAVLACVIVLFNHRARKFQVTAIAQSDTRQLAPSCTGRLKSLNVQLFDTVLKGDELALIDTVLDNENIQAQLDIIFAEIERLNAQLQPQKQQILADNQQLQNDINAQLRRLDIDLEAAKLRVLELKTIIETDKILAKQLKLDVDLNFDLLQQDAVAPYQLTKARAEYDAISEKIKQNNIILTQAQTYFQSAQKRKNDFTKMHQSIPSPDEALAVIQKEILVQQKMFDQLNARYQPLVLKAPINGVVTFINTGTGDIVSPDMPILTIAKTNPKNVIAYVSETQISAVKERMPVKLIKNSFPQQIADSQVTRLGSTIEIMPQRLWQNPNVPQYARPVIIKIPPGFNLVPGETVGVTGL